MSWTISLIDNNIKVNKKTAKEIIKEDTEGIFMDVESVTQDGLLYFDPDHMEHMDFLHREEIQKVLKKNKVKGRALFGDLDGDFFGTFWGYEFDGKGGMNLLEGKLSWSVKKGNK